MPDSPSLYDAVADKDFWVQQRPSAEALSLTAAMTALKREDDVEAHPAAGDGTFGTLTARGLAGMEEVGRTLRRSYATFLPDAYDSTVVSCLSTDFPRTIQSAQAVLHGL